jgi:phosphate starvation-inducible PhoH-like protein
MSREKELEEKIFQVTKTDPLILYGINDSNLKLIEKEFPLQLIARGNQIKIKGSISEIERVETVLTELIFIANKNKNLLSKDVETVIQIIKSEEISDPFDANRKKPHSKDELDEVILFTKSGFVKPRTPGQKQIVKETQNCDIVVAIGPAGTGKTYLAVSLAVAALKNKEVKKIVLARPAVEAGENLGFLPGDFREKIDPYLRPLYDALSEMLPKELLKKYMEQLTIEVIPLAYMRGRTLNNAFVILDEAQNATSMQMKMFLTRLGVNSKSIINGDITQIDLPNKSQSGLVEIQSVLDAIEGISFVYLDRRDVVRHRLVQDIIFAYNEYSKEKD